MLDIHIKEIENIALSSKDTQYIYERQFGRMGNGNGKRTADERFLFTNILYSHGKKCFLSSRKQCAKK